MFAIDPKNNQPLTSLAREIIEQEYPRNYIGDGMVLTNRNHGFLEEEKFVSTLHEIAKAPIYQQMAWRVHTLVWAIEQVRHLKGDFVECGVFRGFKSYFLCKYFQFETMNRKFWLYDTFEGLAEKYSDGSPVTAEEHNKANLLQFVTERFSFYENVKIIQGIVPDSFDIDVPEEVAFLHLDMNSYQAEIGALEELWSRMPSGGIVILDDYGLYDYKAQKEHEDLWFSRKGHSILELPTAQGLVIKK